MSIHQYAGSSESTTSTAHVLAFETASAVAPALAAKVGPKPAQPANGPSGEPNEDRRFRLYSDTDLEAFPDPEYLIEGYIEERGLTVVYGPSGGGKTFCVLDMAMSIASNTAWMGKQVKPGAVIYVVGEGTVGIKKRVAAWKQTHQASVEGNLFFVRTAVQLLSQIDVNTLISEIRQSGVKNPVLVVFDTLATSFVGGDENSSQDMGRMLAMARELYGQTGTAVVLVHHTGKVTSAGERGSNALHAGVEASILIQPENSSADERQRLQIISKKLKDDEKPRPLFGALRQVSLPPSAKGKPQTSCVLEGIDATRAEGAVTRGAVDADLRAALDAFVKCGSPIVKTRDWQHAFGQSAETLNRRIGSLVEKGFVNRVQKGQYELTALYQSTVTNDSRPAGNAGHHQSQSPPFGVTLTAEAREALEHTTIDLAA